jgi:chemotaxis protein histidine kinase CheA
MPDNVVALADYSVKIEDETFQLTQIPDEKSKLVEKKKKDVLNNLNLSELISGLKRSGSLLFLAYNGVAGFGELRKATNDLQDKLGVLCRDSELALDRFGRNTAVILGKLQQNFRFLVEGKEAIAIRFLAQCAETAATMATEATALARRFDGLADDTMVVCGNAQIQQGQTDAEKRKLDQDLVDLKAKDANARKLSTDLAEQRKKLQKLYDEAKEKADKAADRGFAVALVGAILGPIASGIGAVAGAYTGRGGGAPSTPPPTPTPTSSEKTAAEKKVEEAKAAKITADKELETAKGDQTKANEAKTAAVQEATKKATDETLAKEAAKAKPDDTKLADAAKQAGAAATKASADKTKAEDAEKVAAEKVKEKEAAAQRTAEAVTAAGRALETAAKNLETVGASLLDLAKTYEAEKGKYLDLMLKYQEQETQALANMAEYAVRMSSVTSRAEVEKTVSQSLCQAIAAFNAVAQILRNAALFWTQMADACRALSSGGVQATVKSFSDMPEKDRLEIWKEDFFKKETVEYMAQWKAMELICREYSKAAGETRTEVQANIVKSPSPEESMKLVPELAKALALDARRAEGQADAKSDAIKQEIKPKAA